VTRDRRDRARDPRHDARVIRSGHLLTSAPALALAVACGGKAAPPARPPAPAQHASAEPEHGGGHDHGAGPEHHGGDHEAAHADHDGGEALHHFENAEESARSLDDPARDARQQPDRVIAALALAPAMVVADIGAGTGYFAVRLARAVPRGQVIATDVEPDMVRYMTERARREGLSNLRAVQTPPGSPELDKASVDRVLVVDVWHHLGDRAAYAKLLAEALRPGGLIAVVDFKLESAHGPPPKHRLTPEAIAADLRAAGLKTEISAIDLPEQYIVIGRR
jgi:SAM-dependent methyltransferase